MMHAGVRYPESRCPSWAATWRAAWHLQVCFTDVWLLSVIYSPFSGNIWQIIFSSPFFLDYHVVADGYGGKGYLVRREDESRLTDIVRQAQKEAQEGKAVLLNVLIGKTNFREGSISV